MKIRFYLALWISKFSRISLKLLKRNASHFPGVIALKICPDFIKRIDRAKLIIGITGTNGKTTTTNMIADFLEINGSKIATNRLGANIDTGVATALASSVTIFNKSKKDAVVLELDERFSRRLLPDVVPHYLVVTNLFRDSIKRNAHPEFIFNILRDAIPSSTKCILNANDLCSSRIGDTHESVYYGMGKLEEDKKQNENLIMDYSICPNCDTPLTFDSLKYHHIGICHCENCGFESKKADLLLKEIKEDKIVVDIKGEEYTFPKVGQTVFNLYNELATIALFKEIQFSHEKMCETLKKQKVVNTRLDKDSKNGIKIVQMMAKGQNSVSCSRTFDYVGSTKENKAILIMIDDYFERQDSSEFIGWIHDADFEYLNKESVKQILVAGPRYLDYKVRFLMTGFPKEKMEYGAEEVEVVDKINLKDIETVYILYDTSTYHLVDSVKKKLISVIEKRKSYEN